MKQIALLVENLYDEHELIYPYHRLREEYIVHLVGSEKDTVYTSKSGLPTRSTHSSAEIKAEDYAGLFIPGGFSPDHMRRSQATRDLVSQFDRLGKPIAAICHGPWLLASALDLTGRKMTSFFSIKDDLIHAGATWLDQEAVIDKNLITSRNPGDLPALLKAFLTALN